MHVLLDLYGVLLDHEKMFRGYRDRLAELLSARFGGAPEAWRRAPDEAWVTYLSASSRSQAPELCPRGRPARLSRGRRLGRDRGALAGPEGRAPTGVHATVRGSDPPKPRGTPTLGRTLDRDDTRLNRGRPKARPKRQRVYLYSEVYRVNPDTSAYGLTRSSFT